MQTLRTPPWRSPPCWPASTAASTPGSTWSSAATSCQTSPAACRVAAGWGTNSATRTRTAASAGPRCCPACRVRGFQSRSETSARPPRKTVNRSYLHPDQREGLAAGAQNMGWPQSAGLVQRRKVWFHHLRFVCIHTAVNKKPNISQ